MDCKKIQDILVEWALLEDNWDEDGAVKININALLLSLRFVDCLKVKNSTILHTFLPDGSIFYTIETNDMHISVIGLYANNSYTNALYAKDEFGNTIKVNSIKIV